MLEDTLTPGTIIDAGHYSYLPGPTELDCFLWGEGVKLYAYGRAQGMNPGLFLLVDDMSEVETNAQRRTFNIQQLPPTYKSILEAYAIDPARVIIASQHRLNEKGRQLLRSQGKSRSEIPRCELVVASAVRHKQRLRYSVSIGFYDTHKTMNGVNLVAGTEKAQKHFGTTIDCHYLVFKDNKELLGYYNPR